MKKIYFTIILFLVSFFSFSQTLPQGWSTFTGKIDIYPITLSIFNNVNNNLSGNYCYNKNEQRINLKGTKKDSIIYLEEIIENKTNAIFKGIIDETNNSIYGKWKNITNNKELNFTLTLSSQSGQSIENRYSLGTSNEEVENFIKKIKTSIINNDKNWISKNINYPVSVTINKKKNKIKSSKDFINNYSKIFTEKFKTDIKKSCSCDIFSNWQGAMFANGLIWINQSNDSLKIISINN